MSMNFSDSTSLSELGYSPETAPEDGIFGAHCELPVATEGARALVGAVLEEAILCLSGAPYPYRNRNNANHLAREAERWVRGVDLTWPFSFENVCATLGLDSSAVRKVLLEIARNPGSARIHRTHRVRPRLSPPGSRKRNGTRSRPAEAPPELPASVGA